MRKFILSLDKKPRGKVLQAIQILSEFGPALPFPYSSQVEGKLRELRAHYGRTLYRILYYQDTQNTFILLHALEKKTPKIPKRGIKIARERMLDHQMRTRKRGGESMAKKKTSAQRFMEEQLQDPEVAASFNEGLEELRLAVQIAQLREKRGLTQTQLAAKLRTSPAVISRIENGCNVELKTLQKIVRALRARLTLEPVES